MIPSEKARDIAVSINPDSKESKIELPTLFAAVSLRLLTDWDTRKRAASDTYHNAYGKRCYRKRRNNRVCGVAVRAEIIRIGNENPIDYIVKHADQQRNYAGQGVFKHQPAGSFTWKIRIVLFVFRYLSLPLRHKKHAPSKDACFFKWHGTFSGLSSVSYQDRRSPCIVSTAILFFDIIMYFPI